MLFEKLIFDGKPDVKGGVSCGHKLKRGLLLKENILCLFLFIFFSHFFECEERFTENDAKIRNNSRLAGYSRQPAL